MSNFKTIDKCLFDLFKKKKNYIDYLSKSKDFGWEKWLQYELAFALNDESIGSSETEVKYPYDMGVKKPKAKDGNINCFIDICFKEKFFKRDAYTAIELKLTHSASGLRGVFSDLLKISAIKNTSWNLRGVTVILIYKKPKSNTKFNQMIDHLCNKGNGINEKYKIANSQINNSEYNALRISWGGGKTSNWNREPYRKWVKSMQAQLNKNGIDFKTKSGKKQHD